MEWKMRKKRRKRVPTERTTKHSKEQEQDGEMSLSGASAGIAEPNPGLCDRACGGYPGGTSLCTADCTGFPSDGRRPGL